MNIKFIILTGVYFGVCIGQLSCAPARESVYLTKKTPSAESLPEAPISTPFFIFRKNEPAVVQTSFQIGYDNKNLYLAIQCYEPHIDGLKALCREHDGPVWQDDCIEIFIDPGLTGESYFQFIFNSIGMRQEGRKTAAEERFSVQWNGDWEVATAIFSDRWTGTATIPFSTLGAYPQKGGIWGMNICRERYSGNTMELSSWSKATSGFHTPREFGILVFEDLLPSLKETLAYSEKKMRKWREMVKKDLRLYKHSAQNSYSERFNQMEKELQSIQKQLRNNSVTVEQFYPVNKRLISLPSDYENLAIDLEMERLIGGMKND
ncbi:MAG: hypothetical protein JW957_05535 [Candidatus Omnitrophica bacterium]|nr:hypothetical protein [Candidatus Omnitrophota bacterium]